MRRAVQLPQTYQHQAALFRAVSHPARVAIIGVLRGGEQCVCHLEASLGLRQSFISQQLMVLRRAGLVEDRRDGWNIFYRLTTVGQRLEVALTTAGYRREGSPKAIREGSACPCPKCSRKRGLHGLPRRDQHARS